VVVIKFSFTTLPLLRLLSLLKPVLVLILQILLDLVWVALQYLNRGRYYHSELYLHKMKFHQET
jgi:hypothetical protein